MKKKKYPQNVTIKNTQDKGCGACMHVRTPRLGDNHHRRSVAIAYQYGLPNTSYSRVAWELLIFSQKLFWRKGKGGKI